MNTSLTRTIAAIACACLGVAALGAPNATADTIKRTLPAKSGGQLTVRADIGSIEITSSSTASDVRVEIERDLQRLDRDERDRVLSYMDIAMDSNDTDTSVTIDFDRDRDRNGGGSFLSWLFGGHNGNRVRITMRIVVPSRYDLDLRTSGGGISVDDLRGSVLAKTSGGRLSFKNIEGPVNGNTSGGGITLESCRGDADLHTSGGGITIGDVAGRVTASTSGGGVHVSYADGPVTVSTSGGGITIEETHGTVNAHTSGGSIHARMLDRPTSDCDLSTSGGSITVAFPKESSLSLHAETSGGKVLLNAAGAVVRGTISSRKIDSEINGGGPRMTLRTSGGNITLNNL